jgi:hypothetical protein
MIIRLFQVIIACLLIFSFFKLIHISGKTQKKKWLTQQAIYLNMKMSVESDSIKIKQFKEEIKNLIHQVDSL